LQEVIRSGLIPRWWSKTIKEAKMATFNTRVETIETKPFFRDAFKRTRCLIPMSGYYEWQDAHEWKDRQTGERLKSCTMIITESNDFAAEIHDRMPVFLTETQFAPWLSGEAGAGILKPAPNDFLQRWPVSKRVNSSKAEADDATLIERVELSLPKVSPKGKGPMRLQGLKSECRGPYSEGLPTAHNSNFRA
jgi:putative SOS response-associated peptidase YedK